MPIYLVDSSAWIEALRARGDAEVRSRVQAIVDTGQAAWCPMIELELWNGARGEREKRALQKMAEVLITLELDAETWAMACHLARTAREGGKTVPATDLVILACARRHGVELVHADRHYDVLADLAGA